MENYEEVCVEIEDILGKISKELSDKLVANNSKCLSEILLGITEDLKGISCTYDFKSGKSFKISIPFCESWVFLNNLFFCIIMNAIDGDYSDYDLVDDIYRLTSGNNLLTCRVLYQGVLERLQRLNELGRPNCNINRSSSFS